MVGWMRWMFLSDNPFFLQAKTSGWMIAGIGGSRLEGGCDDDDNGYRLGVYSFMYLDAKVEVREFA